MEEFKKFRGKISVLMAVYNEGVNICSNIRETQKLFEKAGCEYEIIAINDGSSDNSLEEIKQMSAENSKIKIARNTENQGKGLALRTGFRYATGDLIIFLDSDLDIHPYQIISLYNVMRKHNADVVIGCKFHPESQLNYPTPRKVISYIYAALLGVLFRLPLRDTQTGLKLFKAEVLKEVFPRILCKRFAFDVEALALAQHMGFKISEAPIKIDFKREKKWGRIGLRDLLRTGVDTLAIFYRLYIMKYYDRKIYHVTNYPMVSIIIAVDRDNPNLRESIEHCLELNYPEFEVLVLPDEQIELNLSKVKIIPTGHIKPADKRDIGARKAQGEVLAFLDDDTYPTHNWLINAVRNFEVPEVAAVGGPALTPRADNIWQQMSGMIFESTLISGNYTYRYLPKSFREIEDYPSCNLFIRKSIMEEIGGFDTKFWPGEDTILCLKIVKELGKKIVYDPDVEVFHHRRELFGAHLGQVKSYAFHRGYFVKKFPETSLKLSYFIPSIFTIAVLVGWLTFFLENQVWGSIYLNVTCFYSFLVILRVLRIFNYKMALGLFSGIIATHFTYGLWFLKGLLSTKLPEEKA